MSLRLHSVAIDCKDPASLARWWSELLGWPITEEEADGVSIADPHGDTVLDFLVVPDDKAVKNRLHLDLRPDDQAAEVARAESLGARRVSVGQGDDVTWVVLADPEGNEFCILRAL